MRRSSIEVRCVDLLCLRQEDGGGGPRGRQRYRDVRRCAGRVWHGGGLLSRRACRLQRSEILEQREEQHGCLGGHGKGVRQFPYCAPKDDPPGPGSRRFGRLGPEDYDHQWAERVRAIQPHRRRISRDPNPAGIDRAGSQKVGEID